MLIWRSALSSLLVISLALVGCADGADGGEGEGEEGEGEEGEGEGEEGEGEEGEGESELSEAIFDACLFAAACGYAPEVTNDFARCQDDVRFVLGGVNPKDPIELEVYDRLLRCGGVATDCDSWNDCAMGGDRAFCQSNGGSGCNGDFFVSCISAGDVTPGAVDCAALGLACTEDGCGERLDACATATSATACLDDDTVLACSAVQGELDCPAGSACVDTGSAGVCSAATACDTEAVACDGETFVFCDGQFEGRLDCAAFGRTCDEQQFCAAAGDECIPGSTPEGCNGDAFRVCSEGVFVDVPCSDLGFNACVETGGGAGCVNN